MPCLDRALVKAGSYLLIFAVALFLVARQPNLTYILFREQDAPVLIVGGCALLALARWSVLLPRRWIPRPPRHGAALLVAAVLLVTLAGTWLVFGDYPLSRDEVLADFDADFLRRGLIVAPVPSEWRPFADAMMPIFMLPVPGDAGWLSGYLPGNAALRALAGLTVGAPWASPLLAATAAFALSRIGRRLWPEAPGAALVPLLLLCASPQFLAMAMTPYAMTAHLAFNLLWLWCFLRDDRRGDAGALAAGFVATGLHQMLFHPLFVLPFIVELLIARNWRRAAVYGLGYALIGLFWTSYWQIALSLSGLGASPHEAAAHGLPYLIERVVGLIAAFDISGLVLMAFNLLRFAAWQHLLLLPLALLGWDAVRRREGIARPLAAGIVLLLVAMFILLPWQGHGWGYRYLHGFLGSFALLAGHGWRRIVAAGERRGGEAALGAATALTLLVILPFLLCRAHDFVRPYRVAHAMIVRAPADVVLVDGTGLFYAQDLVRNAPDAANRPIVMDMMMLDENRLRALCGRYRVAVFDRRDGVRAGIRTVPTEDFSGARQVLDRIGCGVPLTADPVSGAYRRP